jgi:hypothetical protein
VLDRCYRLTVRGELSDKFALVFDGMTLSRVEGNTALTGRVRDQAEFQGLLRRISDFGLILLEAKAMDDGAEPTTSDASQEADRR